MKNELSAEQLTEISAELRKHGVQLIDSHINGMVSKIRAGITLYMTDNDLAEQTNLSCYLSEKLGYSYALLSSVFTDHTYSTIENFIILKRIVLAKQQLISGKYTLTEIAFKLRFSNVSHLSGQFKKVTGLTPSRFIKILQDRSELEAVNTYSRSKHVRHVDN